MAAPQIARYTPYQALQTNEYDVTGAFPSNITAGTLLIFIVKGFDDTANIYPFGAPSGFTSVTSSNRNKDGMDLFAKVADGSEGGTSFTIGTDSPIDEVVYVDLVEVSGFIGVVSDIETSVDNGLNLDTSPAVLPLSTTHDGDVLYLTSIMSAHNATITVSGYTEVAGSNRTLAIPAAVSHLAEATSNTGSAPVGTYSSDVGLNPIRLTVAIPEQGTIPSATVTLDSGNDVRSPGQTISGTYSYFDGDPTGGPLSITSGGVTHSTDDIDPFLTNLVWGTDTVDGNGKHSGTWSVDLGGLPAQGNSAKGLPFSDSAQVTITDPGV